MKCLHQKENERENNLTKLLSTTRQNDTLLQITIFFIVVIVYPLSTEPKIGVTDVYFDQCLGVAHSKSWSKYAFNVSKKKQEV